MKKFIRKMGKKRRKKTLRSLCTQPQEPPQDVQGIRDKLKEVRKKEDKEFDLVNRSEVQVTEEKERQVQKTICGDHVKN